MLSTGSAGSYDGPGRGAEVTVGGCGVPDGRGDVVPGAVRSGSGAGGIGRVRVAVGSFGSSVGRAVLGSGSGVRVEVGDGAVLVLAVGSVVGEAVVVVVVDGGGVEVDARADEVLRVLVAMAANSGRVTRTARRIARRGPVMATF
ncbi:hypothetical protein [Luteipulveratus halotolerans]|nr:hypothetical protein [Luteipulveratus halotolerans]